MDVKLNGRTLVAAMVAACGLVGGLRANGRSASAAGPAAAKVLHFPRDQYLGSLYIEDPCLGSSYTEQGHDLSLPYGLDPKRLALDDDWDFVGFAQGDAAVPANRDILLNIMLRLRKEDAGRLAGLPALQDKTFGTDRCRADPPDLSGLSALEPNDLYCLTVNSLVGQADADQRVLKPIRHLTGLKILRLHGTGVTDKGMEYLKELRSLRALEFSGESSVGNQGLAALKDLPHLGYLDLDTGATDAGFKALGQFPHLRWLRIRTGRVWGPGLAELARLPNLERLCLWGTSEISDRHIQYLEGLTHLKSLTLWGEACNRLTDASLASLGKLRQLKHLMIDTDNAVSKRGLNELNGLTNLQTLCVRMYLDAMPAIDEIKLNLSPLTNLKTLDLAGWA